ncbi:unnamed protein product [Ixodes hexagonus]
MFPKELDDALATEAYDADVASDASIQKGEMLQEIGRQVKEIANAPDRSDAKPSRSKIKRFFKAVKKAFKEACKAFVKTGKKVFIAEVKAIFNKDIQKMKKVFERYSLDEEKATCRQMLLSFAEDMQLIGSIYIAKGKDQAVGKEATLTR